MNNKALSDLPTIFVVDDNNTNLLVAERALAGDYRVYTMPSAKSMFALQAHIMPDLILLDIEMPEINGFEALKQLKQNKKTAGIPVMFLTSRTDEASEILGFELGAVDFLTKPFSEFVLRNRIKLHLDVEGLIRKRTEEILKLKTGIAATLARVVENRDRLTGGHVERATRYVRVMLEAMLASGIYSDEISQWDLEETASSARLHDVGKIVVSDLILNKSGRLTAEEFEAIKDHAAAGEGIILDIMNNVGDVVFLQNAKLFAGCHHERWDGTGYPRGLKGEDIPLQGRIMAIADAYDALVSERPYKPAYSHEKALRIIVENRGKQFDPKIVDAFLAASEKFAEVV